jgi:hypothetical protein
MLYFDQHTDLYDMFYMTDPSVGDSSTCLIICVMAHYNVLLEWQPLICLVCFMQFG